MKQYLCTEEFSDSKSDKEKTSTKIPAINEVKQSGFPQFE